MDELAAKQVLLDFEIIALIALVLGVAGYVFVRRLRHREVIDRSALANRFDGFDLALMFFPALLFLMNPVAEAMIAASGVEKPDPADRNEVSAMLVHLVVFVLVGVMTYGINQWVRDRDVTELFGLRRLAIPLVVVFSILGSVASLVVCAKWIGELSNLYLESLFGELDVQDPVRTFQESKSNIHLGLSILTACVVAPVVEELLFRGYMYGVVKRFTGPVFSAVVIGALFAVVHGNLPALLPLWGFSIMLCAAYEITRCLWVPIGMHALFNGANIVLMLVADTVELAPHD
ncbi:MAG: CPBP family intramembrane glutamic endopeptidase [Verrucomicrobiales bacterium]